MANHDPLYCDVILSGEPSQWIRISWTQALWCRFQLILPRSESMYIGHFWLWLARKRPPQNPEVECGQIQPATCRSRNIQVRHTLQVYAQIHLPWFQIHLSWGSSKSHSPFISKKRSRPQSRIGTLQAKWLQNRHTEQWWRLALRRIQGL